MNVTRSESRTFRGRGSYSGYCRTQPFLSRRGNFGRSESFEIHRIARTPSRITPSSSRNSGPNRRFQFSTTSSSGHPCSTPSDRRTPRSGNSSSAESDSSCIVALSEGRGQARGEVGIAAIDIHRPHLIMCQISDGQTYLNTLTKLHLFTPMEILVPNTFCDGKTPSKVFSVIREQCPRINIVCVQRRHFNDAQGRKLVNLLCAPEYASVELLLSHKFYALSAAAALLKYVEYIQNLIFAPKSLKVEYQGSQNTTVIDVDTALRLELVASLFGHAGEGKVWGRKKGISGGGASESKPSLLNILNHCYTVGGLRLLRASILQPPCLASIIETRLESVTELVSKPALSDSLGCVLGQLSDVENLLTLCMISPDSADAGASGDTLLRLAESRINYALLLKTSLGVVQPLLDALEEACTPFLRGIRKNLVDPRYNEMLELIGEVLHDDARVSKGFASAHLQRCFAVRPGINGLLDVARKTYSEIVGDITSYVTELSEEHSLNLRVNYNASRGFHIQLIPMDNMMIIESELPKEFIQVQKIGRTLTFVTQELIEFDMRCKVALQEIQTMSNVVILELLGKLREQIGSLYKLCESVAVLDMLLSLSRVSSLPGYCQPRFNSYLNVINGRHPLLDFFGSREPVPNSVYASNHFNFHVITGPNMSGKSIFIKMVALLQIMAQVGCFIPAERATFRISDRIFSRIGFDDSIECNASTFVLELKEMQYILQSLTSKSLVIIDELCRGTSIEEGTALAWALSEELLQPSAFVLLTTHFSFLTKLASVHPNVTNFHLRTEEHDVQRLSPVQDGEETEDLPPFAHSRLHYTHRLESGTTSVENYGLKLAQVSGLPPSVLSAALRIHGELCKGRKPLPPVEVEAEAQHSAHRLAGEAMRLADDLADCVAADSYDDAAQRRFAEEYNGLVLRARRLGLNRNAAREYASNKVPPPSEDSQVAEGSRSSMAMEENCVEVHQSYETVSHISHLEESASSIREKPTLIEMVEPVFVECDVIIEE
ncbi:mutS protein homolog 4-like [Ischnura elegans]|uniref:mutS protein homolog 4-like n=1 Tax=Ischnura elegans TaxID=197161 RepID=UPI001ED89906|nr:mutS protein homolog 4-like [Ischnura elegans]